MGCLLCLIGYLCLCVLGRWCVYAVDGVWVWCLSVFVCDCQFPLVFAFERVWLFGRLCGWLCACLFVWARVCVCVCGCVCVCVDLCV